MTLIKAMFCQDFLLFFLGVYGPWLAKRTQTLISKCDTNVFTIFFLIGMYILISF